MGRPKKIVANVADTAGGGNDTEGNDVGQEAPEQVAPPSIDDIGWTDYVLGKLDPKKELVDGKPKAAGLRRIFSQVTDWAIVESGPNVVQCPMPENEQRATVVFTIGVRHKNDFDINHTQRFSDASDCYWGNTAKPFCRHPVATAATMAEGRVLRKILKLNVVTLEETLQPTADEDVVNDIMTDSAILADKPQKNAIKLISDKNGIDLRKAMIYHQLPVPDNESEDPLSLLSRVDAATFIQTVMKYGRGSAQGGLDIPAEIKRGNK